MDWLDSIVWKRTKAMMATIDIFIHTLGPLYESFRTAYPNWEPARFGHEVFLNLDTTIKRKDRGEYHDD